MSNGLNTCDRGAPLTTAQRTPIVVECMGHLDGSVKQLADRVEELAARLDSVMRLDVKDRSEPADEKEAVPVKLGQAILVQTKNVVDVIKRIENLIARMEI